jgi:hypothetical protein
MRGGAPGDRSKGSRRSGEPAEPDAWDHAHRGRAPAGPRRGAPASATSLSLTIATIENPAPQAFSLAASLAWTSAGGGPVEAAIGSVTPFPATQPGSFVLGLPDAVRNQLARATGPQTLRLLLQPIAADRPLAEPLRVTVGDPVWR